MRARDRLAVGGADSLDLGTDGLTGIEIDDYRFHSVGESDDLAQRERWNDLIEGLFHHRSQRKIEGFSGVAFFTEPAVDEQRGFAVKRPRERPCHPGPVAGERNDGRLF